jgi:UDP-glucose 4-epimerase
VPAATAAPKKPRRRARPLTVVVTGATGTVGQSLVRMLEADSRVGTVRALARHRRGAAGLGWREVEVTPLDVRNRAAVGRALEGADVVVHLAFQIYGLGYRERSLFDVNVSGSLNVARAAVAAGVERFVYASSAAVYGSEGDHSPLREDDPLRPSGRHFYSRHKAQAEQLVGDTLGRAEIDTFVFRPCAIGGPHAAGAVFHAYPRPLVQAARAGVSGLARVGLRPLVPPPPVPIQMVHEDDVAVAMLQAVRGKGAPGTYNLAPLDSVPGPEAMELMGFRPLPVPAAAGKLAIRGLRAVPATPPALGWPEILLSPLLLDSSAAEAELGWRPRHSSRQTLAETRRAARI